MLHVSRVRDPFCFASVSLLVSRDRVSYFLSPGLFRFLIYVSLHPSSESPVLYLVVVFLFPLYPNLFRVYYFCTSSSVVSESFPFVTFRGPSSFGSESSHCVFFSYIIVRCLRISFCYLFSCFFLLFGSSSIVQNLVHSHHFVCLRYCFP